MSMILLKPFTESMERFEKLRKHYNTVGYCQWHQVNKDRYLECYNTTEGQIIVSYFKNGQGYEIFKNY